MSKEQTTVIKQTTTIPGDLPRGLRCALLLACVAIAGWFAVVPAPAHASTSPAPAWALSVTSQPTNFAPGATTTGTGVNNAGLNAYPQYFVVATNVGGAATSGAVTFTDQLPAGVTPSATVSAQESEVGSPYNTVACTASGQTVTCTVSDAIVPGEQLEVWIPVDVSAGLTGSVGDQVSMSGGGAMYASASTRTTISASPASFGFVPGDGLSVQAINADGSADTQAGSTPYALTLDLNLATLRGAASPTGLQNSGVVGAGHVRDIATDLPAGMVVNPQATPVRCTEAELESDTSGGGCPDASAVGTVATTIEVFGPTVFAAPVYNMVPPAGVPAELAFDADGAGLYVHLMGGVQTGGNYSLTATASDVPALPKQAIQGVQVSLWGNPSAPSHDPARGECEFISGSCTTPAMTIPFLSMPSACSGPLTASMSVDSWESPGSFDSDSAQTTDANGNPVGVSGCQSLDFTPSLTVQPDTTVADSPSGLNVDLHVPQSENVGTLAEANLQDATVTLPEGVTVDPSAASGLTSCTPDEIGIDNADAPSCPNSSEIGTVEIDTPLLSDPLTGGIYVAEQDNNPFNSLLAIYLTAYADGALIKLAGQVTANPVTGQLTTTFSNNPQLPFTDFKLDFFGGSQGILATPEQCGTYTTTSDLSSWSGGPDATPGDSFTIDSGCVSGFAPTFTAGTQNAQAGAYSPFVLSLQRADTDQNFQGLSVKLPEGLLANLSKVSECSDADLAAADASTGTAELANPSCPANSQVGTVTAGSGTGPDPFFLSGKVYLTGPYKGAPYGLAIVVPAVAGPYDLGTVVVRQALQINPDTAQVTDVSDNFPTILQGIPLDIRRVDVDLNRPDFTINPTSCDPMAITGTATSVTDASASVGSAFQVGGCAALGFSPKLKIALRGKGQTRSADHPTLNATYTVPSGDANTSNVRVALPLSLALDPNNSQVVCPWANVKNIQTGAADCPADTRVGTATAYTPLLSQPLTGPVWLVQGLQFHKNGTVTHTLPKLLVTLRGQIALNLWAQTGVNGAEQLVSTFSNVPDAAVSKFDLTIDGGKHGILVITGRGRSICTAKQVANGTFAAHSGKSTGGQQITLSTPCTTVAKTKAKGKRKANERGARPGDRR